MKKLKNGCHFVNIDRTEKFQITNPPPKVWVSGFPSVDGNGISLSAIMKKLKNGCHFVNIDSMEKFQITNPTKFGSLATLKTFLHGDLSALGNLETQIFQTFLLVQFSPSPIQHLSWRIKHSCVDIYVWFTSHLCVVLHFLILSNVTS